MYKKTKIFLALALPLAFILLTCNNTKPATTEPEIPPVHELTLIAAGDNLFHITVINTHKHGNTYNFAPIYTEVKSLIQSADLAFINQETVMAGTAFGYSGYPAFNSPQSLGRTLADTGFDIVNIANNHAMDMGRAGLYNTLDFLDTIHEFTVIGARKAGVSHKIVRKNNIALGFLSYTFSLNGIPLPEGEPNLVSMINRDRMKEEIAALKPLCDFLIVSMHWGDEYELIEPVKSQKDLAVFLAEQNVDLIIGHHPHVLQRVETLKRADGKDMLCFYSLGNFASNQREKERVLGGMMYVKITKDESSIGITDSGLIPVVCHFEQGFQHMKMYPLYEYTEKLLSRHLLHSLDKTMDFGWFNEVIYKLNTKIIMYDPFNK
jgi:poly-gamma-glutamate synthesis protein (capsule biosynthesis protein)